MSEIYIASETTRHAHKYNSYKTAHRYGKHYLKDGGTIYIGKTIYIACRYYSDWQGMYVSDYTTLEKFYKERGWDYTIN